MVPLGIRSETVAGEASAIALLGKFCARWRDGVGHGSTTTPWKIVFRISDSGAPKMKKWLGIFLVGGLLSLVGTVNHVYAQEDAPKGAAPTEASAAPATPPVLPPNFTGPH